MAVIIVKITQNGSPKLECFIKATINKSIHFENLKEKERYEKSFKGNLQYSLEIYKNNKTSSLFLSIHFGLFVILMLSPIFFYDKTNSCSVFTNNNDKYIIRYI